MSSRGTGNYLNRELSWLEFNSRVLEEAQDVKNPLLERLRFYCIFHSNLDEFFMVRVASLLRRVAEGDVDPDPSGLTPRTQLERVLLRVRELQEASSRLYEEKLLPALAREKIHILSPEVLTPEQCKALDDYFDREIYPVLTPVAVDEVQSIPRLAGLAVNLAVLLIHDKPGNTESHLAVVQVPSRLPGLFRIPDAGAYYFCWLSDLVRRGLPKLFPGYRILETAAFRITRDSEIELDDEGQVDYVRTVESGLKNRRKALAIRLEHECQMSAGLCERLCKPLEVDPSGLLPVSERLDPRPLLNLVDLPGYDKLRYRPQPPLIPLRFEQERSIFDIIREGDVILHHPYDSFDPVVELIQAAGEDPDVLAIKQTLYRTSGNASPLVHALRRAAESGKQVTVLMELTARFDEERNIRWARDLEDAGAHVLYGIAGLKVHAKIALVVRREPTGIRRYVHLGTGNYNERTAKLYTDYGLLTAAEDIGSDASSFFNTITGYSEPSVFNHLVVAPLGMRDKIISLIRREADWARSGQVSGITAKMNALVDPKIIQELYQAGMAGVPIRLNVRGICCLRPGVQNLSENINVVSIVDRYLEHSRILVLHNGGNPEVYLSSADWMPRNLDRRVELMFPVIQEQAKLAVIEALDVQFADNQKARLLRADGKYERIPAGKAEAVRAQEFLHRCKLEDRERQKSVTPVRFVPLEGSS